MLDFEPGSPLGACSESVSGVPRGTCAPWPSTNDASATRRFLTCMHMSKSRCGVELRSGCAVWRQFTLNRQQHAQYLTAAHATLAGRAIRATRTRTASNLAPICRCRRRVINPAPARTCAMLSSGMSACHCLLLLQAEDWTRARPQWGTHRDRRHSVRDGRTRSSTFATGVSMGRPPRARPP